MDANGDVLDILVQSRRNKAAAKRFFRKLFKVWGRPRVIVTDKLRSYGCGERRTGPGDRASPTQRVEQSRRGFAQTYTAARKDNGSLQVARSSAKVLVGSRSHRCPVPTQTPPSSSPFLSPRPSRCLRALDRVCTRDGSLRLTISCSLVGR